jgi:hypothetical protein
METDQLQDRSTFRFGHDPLPSSREASANVSRTGVG